MKNFNVSQDISANINFSLNLTEVINIALINALKLVQAERGVIFIRNSFGKLELFAQRNSCFSLGLASSCISMEIVWKAISTGMPILRTQERAYTVISGSVSVELRTIIAVPIFVKENVMGVIYIDDKREGKSFDERDLNMIKIYASYIALAIEKSGLEQERSRLYALLAQFLGSDVAELLLAYGYSDFIRENREAAILFADIRSFTEIAEKIDSRSLFDVLNIFFDSMLEILLKRRGCLLKYLGDGFMASFGMPKENKNASEDAVKTAIEMISALAELNKFCYRKFGMKIDMGAGIHSGKVTAGIIGGFKRKEWSIIGDIPNTASRLESLTKNYDTQLIVSENTLKKTRLQDLFIEIGIVSIRGKKEKIKIFMLKSKM